ncbi:MAG: hypothetical protein KDC52_03475 [Ignavibacteriae bacterium]|nr:hypothetical protein [Ignavibacteriota bacterium]MCB9206792.1 hypothetical protein [Ignavibacteriales bacterium]MCB9210200.1 hypothetical protein [Ignavibacteriales bacterium]MCB9218415.1 hypothetical protein [Ignavibacteriales bacterium]MCB9259579.1 hypothetical protein [Ignavibacteriales bacterium]
MINENKYQVSVSKEKQIVEPITGIFDSIKSGLFGFIITFSLVLFTKLLSYASQSNGTFSLDSSDIVISVWSLLVISFIVFASANKNLLKK